MAPHMPREAKPSVRSWLLGIMDRTMKGVPRAIQK